MNHQDKQTLTALLTSLLCAQDDVTYMNGKGKEWEQETRTLIAKRNKIRNDILEFVDSIVSDVNINQSVGTVEQNSTFIGVSIDNL